MKPMKYSIVCVSFIAIILRSFILSSLIQRSTIIPINACELIPTVPSIKLNAKHAIVSSVPHLMAKVMNSLFKYIYRYYINIHILI